VKPTSTQGRKPLAAGTLIVFVIAIVANAAALLGTSSKSAGDGDGPFYISIARNLAAGKGYVLGESFYPDKPTMGRAPVWPALLAIPALIAPRADDHTLLRDTAACLNSLSAVLLFGITWTLSRNLWVSVVAGLGYAAYPVALALTAGGNSEIPYVFVAGLGIFHILRRGRSEYVGALVLGLSPLVRSNFVLLPVMAAVAACWVLRTRRQWVHFAILAALFWLPSGLWIARNYAVSGEFPVLSTIEGETLYGANNEHVATDLKDWGYWVFPNDIPGETAKRELAQTMSERQIDRYYHQKGMAYLKAHWPELPRLEVGKVVRAFVPVPWVANWSSDAVFFCRAILYPAILLTLRTFVSLPGLYRLIVTGMFLVLVVTVLIYYGTYRFTFCVEVFLIPAVAIGAFDATGRLRRAAGVEAVQGHS
jgi:hypothetical protein